MLARLRVHLDWIQYRQSFREAVAVRRAVDCRGAAMPLVELAIDVRQATRAGLAPALAAALEREPGGVALESFGPLRASVIWGFNTLFWQHVAAWEAVSGRPFEHVLPSGRSDASLLGAPSFSAPPQRGRAASGRSMSISPSSSRAMNSWRPALKSLSPLTIGSWKLSFSSTMLAVT